MTAPPPETTIQDRRVLLVSAAIAIFVVFSHIAFLNLPFYWDELGQFVPASLDLFQDGSWIPHSTVANVHPPGVMAYLAVVWSIAGYSIAATRLAMLALAALGAVLTFRLAIRMGLQWNAAILAAGFLATCPLFFAQSMMAELDMPAMVFLVIALALFLEGHIPAAAFACTVLVMVKETGLVAPAWFCFWLWLERRRREALWFLLPLAPLIIWLIALHRGTGHWFGNAAFTQYNLWYPLHPVRLALALLRRLYYLFGGSGHLIGAVPLVIAWRRTTLFRTRAWRIAGGLLAIATMFPLASAYRRPEFGYVHHPLNIREISDFRASSVAPLAKEDVELFVLYSGTWDPIGLMQNATWTEFLRRYYDYEPPVDANQMRVLLGAQPVARWTRRGQWVEIYKR